MRGARLNSQSFQHTRWRSTHGSLLFLDGLRKPFSNHTATDGGDGNSVDGDDLFVAWLGDDGERRSRRRRCVCDMDDDDGDWGTCHDGGRLVYLCCAWQYSALSSWNSIEVGTSRHSVLVDITIAIHIELGMVTGLDRVTWMSFSLKNTCSSSDHHKSTAVGKDRLVTICSIFATFNSHLSGFYSTWHLTGASSRLRLSLLLAL